MALACVELSEAVATFEGVASLLMLIAYVPLTAVLLAVALTTASLADVAAKPWKAGVVELARVSSVFWNAASADVS